MAKKFQYSVRCPLCQKSSVLRWFDHLDDDNAFLVQIREIAGNKGFPIRQEFEILGTSGRVRSDLEDLLEELARRTEILFWEFVESGYIEDPSDNDDE